MAKKGKRNHFENINLLNAIDNKNFHAQISPLFDNKVTAINVIVIIRTGTIASCHKYIRHVFVFFLKKKKNIKFAGYANSNTPYFCDMTRGVFRTLPYF